MVKGLLMGKELLSNILQKGIYSVHLSHLVLFPLVKIKTYQLIYLFLFSLSRWFVSNKVVVTIAHIIKILTKLLSCPTRSTEKLHSSTMRMFLQQLRKTINLFFKQHFWAITVCSSLPFSFLYVCSWRGQIFPFL